MVYALTFVCQHATHSGSQALVNGTHSILNEQETRIRCVLTRGMSRARDSKRNIVLRQKDSLSQGIQPSTFSERMRINALVILALGGIVAARARPMIKCYIKCGGPTVSSFFLYNL